MMKNWITVTVPDGGKDVTTLVNTQNITHIKKLDDYSNPSGGKTRLYLNTSTQAAQRYLHCNETFDMIVDFIAEAQ